MISSPGAADGDGRRAAPPTVYRALEFLLEHGLVHRIESLNAFIGCASPKAPHSGQFLLCTGCGTATEMDDAGVQAALARLAVKPTWLLGLGITGDILYTADQVRALVGAARLAGLPAEYRELRSTKGHDGFLTEWDQLTSVIGEILAQTS